jgi:hypothetical protein
MATNNSIALEARQFSIRLSGRLSLIGLAAEQWGQDDEDKSFESFIFLVLRLTAWPRRSSTKFDIPRYSGATHSSALASRLSRHPPAGV